MTSQIESAEHVPKLGSMSLEYNANSEFSGPSANSEFFEGLRQQILYDRAFVRSYWHHVRTTYCVQSHNGALSSPDEMGDGEELGDEKEMGEEAGEELLACLNPCICTPPSDSQWPPYHDETRRYLADLPPYFKPAESKEGKHPEECNSPETPNSEVHTLQTTKANQVEKSSCGDQYEEARTPHISARERWESHLKTLSIVSGAGERLECSHCQTQFPMVVSYLDHLDVNNVKHENFCPDENCAFFSIGYKFKSQLRRHICNDHLKVYNRVCMRDDSAVKRQYEVFLKFVYVCRAAGCRRAFYRLDSLRRHQRQIHRYELRFVQTELFLEPRFD